MSDQKKQIPLKEEIPTKERPLREGYAPLRQMPKVPTQTPPSPPPSKDSANKEGH
ncbi:MAG: hypothetical protein HYR55_04440 [Acidobacteria bacterium]|nr:hypothetical protein [Acidobacteriota bacterium]MBI3656306.1 hypothetical protein [Acidobacteriota bacterium]